MPWSTPSLLPETLARAHALGISAHQLAPIRDLDTPDDLRAFAMR